VCVEADCALLTPRLRTPTTRVRIRSVRVLWNMGVFMSRIPATFLPVMSCIVFSCWASLAAADPVRVTAGYVDAGFDLIGHPWNANALEITGPGFEIGTALEDEVAFLLLNTPPTVAPGALVDLSGVLHVEDVVGAQLNDQFWLVAAPFRMSFDAHPARLVCSTSDSIVHCSGEAPFTFHADLNFVPPTGDPVAHHLAGVGTVGVLLDRFESDAGAIGRVHYTFEASAVPEPATMSLFGSGAMLTGACVWRRRRQQPLLQSGAAPVGRKSGGTMFNRRSHGTRTGVVGPMSACSSASVHGR
jgi:hypothetical protein